MKNVQRYKRIRALALSVGMVLGLVVTSFGAHVAHAASLTATKKSRPNDNAAKQPEATPEQLQAAERVLVGSYDCEFGKRVSVARNPGNNGYFNLSFGSHSWLMKPVLTQTGTIRLEDVKGAALMIQILTKSMLMDVKAGHRIVDGCTQETQRAAQADLDKQPPHAGLFDSPSTVSANKN